MGNDFDDPNTDSNVLVPVTVELAKLLPVPAPERGCSVHSCLSAVNGSTRVARQAGRQHAKNPTANSNTTTTPKLILTRHQRNKTKERNAPGPSHVAYIREPGNQLAQRLLWAQSAAHSWDVPAISPFGWVSLHWPLCIVCRRENRKRF
jgi:hypothetical protein